MKIKCLFIDDEPLALKILESFAKEFEELEVIGCFTNPLEALRALEDTDVDVIFCDINMPKINGLDVVRNLKTAPLIIITTAYREYAVESFQLNVFDYLVKPIPFDRFLKSVQKITHQLQLENNTQEIVKTEPDKDYAFYKVDKKLIKIYFDDILFVESLKDYIKIFTKQGNYVVYKSLSKITAELPLSAIFASSSFLHCGDYLESRLLMAIA